MCIWCKQKKCLHWQRIEEAPELKFDKYPAGIWPPFGHMEYETWSTLNGHHVWVHHMAYFENPGKLGVSKQFDYELRETLVHNKIFLDMILLNRWMPLVEDVKRQLAENGELEGIRRLSMDAPPVFVIEIADAEGRELRIRTGRVMLEYQARFLKAKIQRYLYRPWSRRVGGRLQRGGRLHGRHLFDIVRIIKKYETRWIFGYRFETEVDKTALRLFVEGPEQCRVVFMHETIQQEEPNIEEPKKADEKSKKADEGSESEDEGSEEEVAESEEEDEELEEADEESEEADDEV